MPQFPVVVGLNIGHDGGCAVLIGDRVRFAISEERLNRYKYSVGWASSLLYCLNAANASLMDVDLFVFSGCGPPLPPSYDGGLASIGAAKAKFITVDHHLSHAFGAFVFSPFEEALVVVMDGWGNNVDTESYYLASRDGIERIGGNSPRRSKCKGIGATYEAFSNFLGFSDFQAGKTMALASYGDPNFYKEPLLDVNGSQVESRLKEGHQPGVLQFARETGMNFGPPFPPSTDELSWHIAAYVQRGVEEAIIGLLKNLVEETGASNICLSGGAALNCRVNTLIREELNPQGFFVLPFASDSGQAIGNALWGYYCLAGEMPKVSLRHCFFGREYSQDEVKAALNRMPGTARYNKILRYRYSYTRESDIVATAAELIAKGHVVGWFQGGSELGPRALGHRSILARPSDINVKDMLDNRVKRREWFRPYAPSVLKEDVRLFLGERDASPFMLEAPKVSKDVASRCPAVVHVDGSTRIQIVDEQQDPIFHRLLRKVEDMTGVGAVLNTSFNVQEPIVETPGDALFTFLTTHLDFMIIHDYLIAKTEAI